MHNETNILQMHSRRSDVLATLAISLQLKSQDMQTSGAKHHHYKLVDMGTFGGQSSYFNSLNLTDAFNFPTVFTTSPRYTTRVEHL